MFEVYYRADHNAQEVLIHDLKSERNKLVSFEITQSLEKIHSFTFNMQIDHPQYNNIVVMLGHVRVVNILDGEVEFEGRILEPTARMSDKGFVKTFVCEGLLSYLNDSTQHYMRFTNTGIKNYLQNVLLNHNNQTEPHKHMHAGNVTVIDTDNYPNSFIGYDTTIETLRKYLKEVHGGVFMLRKTPADLRLDYVNFEDIGVKSQTVLKLGDNILSARRTINFDELITRLVPIGNDIEQEREELPDGQQGTRPKVTIESVNGGKRYIEDSNLIRFAGIIQRPMTFEYVETASELLKKAQDYMNRQSIAVASWEVEAVDKSLIDSNYDKLKVGNTYLIDIQPLRNVEELQIVEKVIRSNNPQRPKLTIGALKPNYTDYITNPLNRRA